MRRIVVASHATLAAGLTAAAELLAGTPYPLHVLNCFVDGPEDLEVRIGALLDDFDAGDEVVVLTDILGGSVNNEFARVLQGCTDIKIHLLSNANLPLLISVLMLDEDVCLEDELAAVVSDIQIKPVYINQLIEAEKSDDEF